MTTNLPNILTLSRIAAIPVVIALLFYPGEAARWGAMALFAAAAITDYFDGYIARITGQYSRIGSFLDPIADKLLVGAVVVMLVATERITDMHIIPALIIVMREITVSGLREFLADLKVKVPVSMLAKWKTVIQMFSLGFLIVGDASPEAIPAVDIGLSGLWIAAFLTLATGYDYLCAGLHHMKEED